MIYKIKCFLIDCITNFAFRLIIFCNRNKDNCLANRLLDLAKRYDTRPEELKRLYTE